MATERLNLQKNIQKSNSSVAIIKIKLKFITLASTKMILFIAVAHVLSLLWKFKFPLTCNLALTSDILTNVLQIFYPV